MEHTLTLELSNDIFEPLTKTAQETGKTPEELAVEWLQLALQFAMQDPVEEFIGAFQSDVPDWADQHEKYLGQELIKKMSGSSES